MKRILDFTVSLFCLILLAPVLILTAFLVRLKLGSPVLFQQVRAGHEAKPFSILKFRTMNSSTDRNGVLLPDSVRLTKFGKFLRETSLDELPGLFNVLIGDMSLVGPRPLLTDYLPHYNSEQSLRHTVNPGITGWAQVNGRNAISWDDKLRLDVWYVKNQSILLDLKILFLTLKKVIVRDGISAEGHATMPRFDDFMIEKKIHDGE